MTPEQQTILNFLLGSGDIDGVGFGDDHPTEKGRCWWRGRLRKAFLETKEPEQEPAFWRYKGNPPIWDRHENHWSDHFYFTNDKALATLKDNNPMPLYTAPPPRREWVGLTVDELIDLEHEHLSHADLVQAIESKLKEKNNG